MHKVKGPFFTYFGGKWRAAPHYPRPKHSTVVECFAGSAGYALRYAHLNVVLCEANDTIRSIWEWLIRVSEAEMLTLPDVLPGETLRDARFSALDSRARSFIGMWMNKGTTGPCWKPSSWTHSGVRPNSSWGPVLRGRLAEQLRFIRHWRLLADYREAPVGPATYFVDPPYQGRLGARYPAHDINYSELSDWCRSRCGQTIVCENAGAQWLPFVPFRTIKGTEGKRRTGVSVEVVWTGDCAPARGSEEDDDGK